MIDLYHSIYIHNTYVNQQKLKYNDKKWDFLTFVGFLDLGRLMSQVYLLYGYIILACTISYRLALLRQTAQQKTLLRSIFNYNWRD